MKEVRAVSNADLRAGDETGLDDPDQIAAISPSKRAALLSNPSLGPDDEPARLLAVRGSRVVGGLDLLAGDLDTPDGPVPIFWGSSLYVAPAMRGQRLGETLLREAESLRPGTGVSAPSRQAQPLYARLGYFDVPLQRHVLVRRTGPLVERWLGRGLAASAATATGDALAGGLRGYLALARKARAARLSIEPCSSFPAGLEPRLQEPRAPFAMHRSAAWLDWAVRESFGDPSHRKALYLVREREEVVGYLLLKARVYTDVTRWGFERLELGSLVDWRIFEPRRASLEHLVLVALEALDRWQVAAIEVCVPPEAGHVSLRRLGFVHADAQHVMLRGQEGSALAADGARDPGRWSVRPAEGDHVFS